MAFQPENKLERSLVQAATDPACRPQFYRDFLESEIFIIQDRVPPERVGRKTIEAGSQLRVQHIEIDGKHYLPVFSSLPRLRAVLQHEAGYMALPARDFLEITKGADLFLNPGSDYGKTFTPAEVASILDGSIWQPGEIYVAKKETTVQIGRPAPYPTEFVEALTRFFKKRREVKRAWIANFFNPERDEKPHTLIALEVSGNWDQVAAETLIVAEASPDPPVDLLQISGGGDIQEYFLNSMKPFYERKLFGLF
jgi:hypothetical protein